MDTEPAVLGGGTYEQQLKHPLQAATRDHHRENGAPDLAMTTVQPRENDDHHDSSHDAESEVVRDYTAH